MSTQPPPLRSTYSVRLIWTSVNGMKNHSYSVSVPRKSSPAAHYGHRLSLRRSSSLLSVLCGLGSVLVKIVYDTRLAFTILYVTELLALNSTSFVDCLSAVITIVQSRETGLLGLDGVCSVH